MSQQPPKGQFFNILMFVAMIFLGWQLLNMNRVPSDPNVKSSDILKQMRELNAGIKDVSIQSARHKLDAKVEEEVTSNKLKREDADRLKLEGAVLVASAQYRAGILRNEFGRVNNAYMTLQDLERKHQTDPNWTKVEYTLPDHHRFKGETKTTGAALYTKIVKELMKRSETDMVMGLFPGYRLIDALVALTGRVPAFSYWFAALLLAVLVRAIIFPLAQKQYLFGKQMTQLAPLAAELKASYTDKKTGLVTNQAEYGQKVMELYRSYGINPLQGCWPALIQLPFFLLIYQCMLHYRFEFQKGNFAWITPSVSQSTGGFVAPNLGERDYILIFIYGVSMIVTTLLAPASTTDPAQAKQSRFLGLAMAVLFSGIMFFWPLPSAFVLYWVFLNILATAHMLWAYRQPLPPLEKVNAPGGGVFPFAGQSGGDGKNGSGNNGAIRTGTPVKHRAKKKK